MTTIDFYTHVADPLGVAAGSWPRRGRSTAACACSPRTQHDTAALDRLLWVQPATGFLPHCRLASPLAGETPIIVDHAREHEGRGGVLVNLSSTPAAVLQPLRAACRDRRRTTKRTSRRGASVSVSIASAATSFACTTSRARKATMPTARELLEQADALMRRNRTGEAREVPPRMTTQSPEFRIATPRAAPAASPRTIQREPIAPSIARTALPVDPIDSLAPPPAEASPAVEVSPPDDDFPLLTEAVDDRVDEPEAANAPLEGLADDVPVLTDAVEEIDVGIVDESARGEPSFWELTARGETSVLGPAPDSVIVVPPVHHDAPAVPPQSPPAGRDPLGLDQPPGDESPIPPDSEPDERADAAAESTRVTDAEEAPAAQAFVVSPLDDLHVEDVRGEHLEAVRSATTIVVEPRPAFEARVSPVDDPAPERPAAPSEQDQQRIREIAEEIGMQVLQRIDIFSDTALRGQLGDRLQPVVERAAAELAAAINEHVGELLRAQIAEAIEREMDRFRQ